MIGDLIILGIIIIVPIIIRCRPKYRGKREYGFPEIRKREKRKRA